MQRAEMEELRQREANLTALQAIGSRKKPKLDNSDNVGSSAQVCYFYFLCIFIYQHYAIISLLFIFIYIFFVFVECFVCVNFNLCYFLLWYYC